MYSLDRCHKIILHSSFFLLQSTHYSAWTMCVAMCKRLKSFWIKNLKELLKTPSGLCIAWLIAWTRNLKKGAIWLTVVIIQLWHGMIEIVLGRLTIVVNFENYASNYTIVASDNYKDLIALRDFKFRACIGLCTLKMRG